MCEGKCDGSCDGSCGDGKDKKRVVEMSAESMASMPLEMREDIDRLVKVLPDGVRIRVIRSDEITDGLKEEMKEKGAVEVAPGMAIDDIKAALDKEEDRGVVKEVTEETAGLLNVGDEESRKQIRRILVLHTLKEICRIGSGLEALENAGVKPLMCVRPGMKGIDGKESKVNTLFGCGECSVNSMLKMVVMGIEENEIGQE